MSRSPFWLALVFAVAYAGCGSSDRPSSTAAAPDNLNDNGAGQSSKVAATHVGPSRGVLVLDGGPEASSSIAGRFVELAGGLKSRIVVIPTAGGNEFGRDPATLEAYEKLFGAGRCTILHTMDHAVADRADFTAPLRDATGVWMSGGTTSTLPDVYGHPATERELRAVLDRGGVIGGSSAGALILGARLPTDQPDKGFAFLRNTLIMAHLNRGRAREMLVEAITASSNIVGLGVSENTAVIVRGDSLEVVGNGDVIVVDGVPHAGQPYTVLRSGDRLVLRPRSGDTPAQKP
jgi:cyanophycinase